jgi:hypothetical protein
MKRCGLDMSCSGEKSVEASCEHGDQSSSSVK